MSDRIADALERIADALEKAHPKPCDDRTCTDRSHWAPVAADPLDESDHRPRHNRYGGHIYRHGPEHWHDYGLEDGRCDMDPAGDDPVRLSDFPGPLTFCDCANPEGDLMTINTTTHTGKA